MGILLKGRIAFRKDPKLNKKGIFLLKLIQIITYTCGNVDLLLRVLELFNNPS